MSRYSDTQLQVTKNLCDLQNLNPNKYDSVSRLKAYFTVNSSLLGGYTGAKKTKKVYCSRHQCSKVLWAAVYDRPISNHHWLNQTLVKRFVFSVVYLVCVMIIIIIIIILIICFIIIIIICYYYLFLLLLLILLLLFVIIIIIIY